MTPSALKALIQSDQTALGHFTAGRDVQCAERCTQIAPTLRASVSADSIQRAASLSGAWAKIVLARESSDTPPENKGVCITFLDWIKAARPIDFDLPEVQQMLGGLVQAGLVTETQAGELSAMGNTPQVITTDEVSACRP